MGFYCSRTKERRKEPPDIQAYVFWGAVLFLVILAVLLRVPGIGDYGVRIDEAYQFETAVGYLETGQFKRWDFVKQKVTESYHRAWPYTWLSAQVMKWTGRRLVAGRYLSLVWGLLLLPVALGICWSLKLNRLFTVLSLYLVTISTFCITISRWFRLYSMFVTCISLGVFGLIMLFREEEGRKSWFILLTLLGFSGSLLTHPMFTVVVIGSVVLWAILEYGFLQSGQWKNIPVWGYTALLIVSMVMGVVAYTYLDRLMFEVGSPLDPYPFYIVYYVQENLGYGIGGLVIGLTLYWLYKRRPGRLVLFIMFVPLLTFVFFTSRFPQVRYLAFLLPVVIPAFMKSAHETVRHMKSSARTAFTIVLVLVILVVPARSAQSRLNYIWKGNMGYVAFPRTHDPRYKLAIEWLTSRIDSDDQVIMCHSFSRTLAEYSERNFKLIPVDPNERIDRKKLLKIQDQREHTWLMFARELPNCFYSRTHRYIRAHYRNVKDVPREFHVRLMKLQQND
ncbi:MAG: phospholipid carrier-dependent glycosyltransferase [bacterium]